MKTQLELPPAPVITSAERTRIYAKLIATALAHPEAHKREAARNAIEIWLALRQRCKESR